MSRGAVQGYGHIQRAIRPFSSPNLSWNRPSTFVRMPLSPPLYPVPRQWLNDDVACWRANAGRVTSGPTENGMLQNTMAERTGEHHRGRRCCSIWPAEQTRSWCGPVWAAHALADVRQQF